MSLSYHIGISHSFSERTSHQQLRKAVIVWIPIPSPRETLHLVPEWDFLRLRAYLTTTLSVKNEGLYDISVLRTGCNGPHAGLMELPGSSVRKEQVDGRDDGLYAKDRLKEPPRSKSDAGDHGLVYFLLGDAMAPSGGKQFPEN